MTPTLPQHDRDPQRRRAELENQATLYAFNRDHFGVIFANEVAKGDGYDLGYALDAIGVAVNTFKNRVTQGHEGWPSAASELQTLSAESPAKAVSLALRRLWETRDAVSRQRPTDHHAYAGLFGAIRKPLNLGLRDDDAFFAWRQLAGMAPISLRRMRIVPDHLALDASVYARGAAGTDRLDAALAEGRLFAVDYAPLAALQAGVTEGMQKYVYAPIAVFSTDAKGSLHAVAIQIGQRPEAGVPMFTPADGVAWRMAKAVVNNSEMIFNGLVAHFGLCHLVAEALCCISRQHLAPSHPLMHLLGPHFEFTTASNETARTSIVNPGGRQDYLMGGTLESNFAVTRAALAAERYDAFGARDDLAARGCDDAEVLREYPLRDDGVPMADALQRWSLAYLRAYYANDAAVQGDVELRAWAEALARDGGFGSLPALVTVESLARFVGDLLWRVTGFHAVMNYAGYDLAAWAEDTPSALFGPGPRPGATEEDWLLMLPPLNIANGMLEQMYSLREIQRSRVGEYPFAHFRDGAVTDALSALRKELDALETATAARDAARRWSFPYLLPSKVPNGIHV